jgi:glutathione S-transferase
MKLHYVARSRASRPRWLLEEAGAVHEIARVDVATGQNKSAAYREIHPHGSVPAFTDDGITIVESAAICMAIADKFPEKQLAPKVGTRARAQYYQWMVYVPATMDPCISEIQRSMRLPPDQQERAAVDAKARWKEIAGFIDRSLSDNEYLV